MNSCLPPDDFEKMVMEKIENVEIDRRLSPYACMFLAFSCFTGFVIASGIGNVFLNDILYKTDMYNILSKFYNMVLYSEFMNNDLPVCLLCIVTGVIFVIYGLLFGVKKNG